MYIMCPDAFYSQTQSNVTYLAILYHSILKPVFSCSAVQVHPIHLKHMKEIWWCIITCVQNHNLLCWEVKIHCALCVHKLNVCWEVRIYFTVLCTQTHKFTKTQCVLGQNLLCTLQLCVHKLTSVKLDQTHTSLTGWSPLWILFKECRQGRIWIRMESTFEK